MAPILKATLTTLVEEGGHVAVIQWVRRREGRDPRVQNLMRASASELLAPKAIQSLVLQVRVDECQITLSLSLSRLHHPSTYCTTLSLLHPAPSQVPIVPPSPLLHPAPSQVLIPIVPAAPLLHPAPVTLPFSFTMLVVWKLWRADQAFIDS